MFVLLILVREDSICSRSSIQHDTGSAFVSCVLCTTEVASEREVHLVGVLADLVYVQLSSPALGSV